MIGETMLLGLALMMPGAVVERVAPAPAAPLVSHLPEATPQEARFYQLVIQRQLIIRIPARPSNINNFSATEGASAPMRLAPVPVVWRETEAPKCIAMRSLAGIQSVQSDSIDLITRDNQRLRAKLKRGCRAHDFYSGLYMKASKDGRLCEDRDALQARSGESCVVDKFRLMVPVRAES